MKTILTVLFTPLAVLVLYATFCIIIVVGGLLTLVINLDYEDVT